jgi:hypothetical protein
MNEPKKKRPSVRPPLMMRWGPDPAADAMREQLESAKAQLSVLQGRVSSLEDARARSERQIRDLLERNTNLVQLTVASQLLCSGGERDEVLDAVEEIIVNMIGSEEIAFFEILHAEARVQLTRTRGIVPTSPLFASAVDPVREALSTGRVVLPPGREVTAVVPLRMDSTFYGAVAVFRLLEQKPALDALDHELLELLSRQAAVAIFSAGFRSLEPTVRPPAKISS